MKLPKELQKRHKPIYETKELNNTLYTTHSSALNIAHNYGKDLINLVYQLIIKDQEKSKEAEILIKQWQTITKMVREAFLSDDLIHIFRITTGAGKTANVIQYIIYFLRFTLNLMMEGLDGIVLLGQEYDNNVDEFENQIKKFAKNPINYVRLEGKWRNCCYNPDSKAENYKIESKKDIRIKDGVEIGLSISYICKNCPNRKVDCLYYNSINKILPPNGKYNGTLKHSNTKFWMSVSHQLNKFLPIFLKKVDKILLIIDENFENAIKNIFWLNLETINESLAFIMYVIKNGYKKKIKGYTTTIVEHERTVKKSGKVYKVKEHERTVPARYQTIKFKGLPLGNLIYMYKLLKILRKGITDKLDLQKLKNILNRLKPFEEESLEGLSKAAWSYIFRKTKTPLKKYYFYGITSFISNYFHNKEIDPTNLDKWLSQAILRIEKKSQDEESYKEGEKEEEEKFKPYLSFVYYDVAELYKLMEEGRIEKLIINNATASKMSIESLLGKSVIIHEKELYSNKIEFHQLKIKVYNPKNPLQKYALYPIRSLKTPSTIQLLYMDIKAIVEAFPEKKHILLISRKSENVYLEHFKRYLWDYLRPISPKLLFESYPLTGTNVYKGKDKDKNKIIKYEDIDVVILLGTPVLSDGVIKRESTLKKLNPEAYKEEKPRNDMIQGMGRIFRGVNKKYVFILSGIDLEIKKPIINHYKHPDFRKAMNEIAKEKAKTIKKETKLDKIYKFLKTHKNQITLDDYANLFKVSRMTASTKLNEFFGLGKLKPKTVGSSHKLIYFIE